MVDPILSRNLKMWFCTIHIYEGRQNHAHLPERQASQNPELLKPLEVGSSKAKFTVSSTRRIRYSEVTPQKMQFGGSLSVKVLVHHAEFFGRFLRVKNPYFTPILGLVEVYFARILGFCRGVRRSWRRLRGLSAPAATQAKAVTEETVFPFCLGVTRLTKGESMQHAVFDQQGDTGIPTLKHHLGRLGKEHNPQHAILLLSGFSQFLLYQTSQFAEADGDVHRTLDILTALDKAS
ncbi:hypothetical protein B0H11DRAFT_1911803 [Mycena galericulata]|nr:hypothetical protein B0H11DRAFT_1911803 [Mycena galericulata]